MARPGLTGHRKFRRLSRTLGSPILARGALELLWDSCYEAGDDYVGTAEDIEMLIGWTGQPGMLTAALLDAGVPEGFGFLEPVSESDGADHVAYRVHDLWHHAPDYVANRRSRENERRMEKACERCGVVYHAADPRSRFCSNACRQGGWRDRNGSRDAASVTRNVTETDRNGSPAPTPARTPAPAPKQKSISAEPSSPPFLVFPVVGPDGPTWTLSEAQVAEWAGLFPNVDVRGETRKALAWVHASPGRHKTARGMARFLVGWLGRSADSGRVRATAPERRGNENTELRRRYAEWTPSTCPHSVQCVNAGKCLQRQDIDAQKAKGRAS